jgi:type IV secretory pathway VirB10-like protein
MPAYRRPREGVAHYPTKYDDCVIRCTGKPYRHQKGSGRAEALSQIVDGMTIGKLTEITSPMGFDPNFVVGSLLKQTGAKDAAYLVEPPEGQTMEQIKARREPRKLTPEQQAAKEAKAQEREAAKAKRAEEAQKRAAEREAAKAAKAAEAAKAAAAKQAEQPAAEGQPAAAAPTKGKGKGKAKAAQPAWPLGASTPEADAEETAAAV